MMKRALALLLATSLTLSAHASQVSWSAADRSGVGDASGVDLPAGDLVRVGNFTLTDAQIMANKDNLAFLESHFIEFGRAAIGDGLGGLPAFWFKNTNASTNALGLMGKRIYYFVYDTATGSTPTQIGVFTAPANSGWIFPDDDDIPNTTSTDLANVPHDSTGLLIGGFGNGTDNQNGQPLYNLAILSASPTPTPTATPSPTRAHTDAKRHPHADDHPERDADALRHSDSNLVPHAFPYRHAHTDTDTDTGSER